MGEVLLFFYEHDVSRIKSLVCMNRVKWSHLAKIMFRVESYQRSNKLCFEQSRINEKN